MVGTHLGSVFPTNVIEIKSYKNIIVYFKHSHLEIHYHLFIHISSNNQESENFSSPNYAFSFLPFYGSKTYVAIYTHYKEKQT